MSSLISKHFCSAAEAAKIIGVDRSQITRYIQAGRLSIVERIGNQIYLRRSEVHRFKRPKPGNPAFRKTQKNS